jgi:hypothetical protein
MSQTGFHFIILFVSDDSLVVAEDRVESMHSWGCRASPACSSGPERAVSPSRSERRLLCLIL